MNFNPEQGVCKGAIELGTGCRRCSKCAMQLAWRVDHLEKQLAEADRRAGAAERERTSTHDQLTQVGRTRATMKDQWGVSQTVSFDQVWTEALQLQKQVRHLLDDLVTESTDPDGFVSYTVQNSLTTTNLIAALKRLPMCQASTQALP